MVAACKLYPCTPWEVSIATRHSATVYHRIWVVIDESLKMRFGVTSGHILVFPDNTEERTLGTPALTVTHWQ